MQIVVATCLLFVCGINAAIHFDQYVGTPESFRKFKNRMQRSIGLSYPYGHLYNPIEPSSNGVFEHVPDSYIDEYRPTYWPFAKPNPMVRDTYPVPDMVPLPYYQTSSIFDADIGPSSQYVPPHRLTPENDYKNYMSALPIAYRQQSAQQMPAKPNLAIQLLTATNVFHGYSLPLPPHQSSNEAAAESTALRGVSYETPNAVVFERPLQTPDRPVPDAFKEQPTMIILALPLGTPVPQEPTVSKPLPEEVPVIVTETEEEQTKATRELAMKEFFNILESEWNVMQTESGVAVNEPSYKTQTPIELGSFDEGGSSSATTTEIPMEKDESTSVTLENDVNSVLIAVNPTEVESNGLPFEEIQQVENEPYSTAATLENLITATEINDKLLSISLDDVIQNNNYVPEKQGQQQENAAFQKLLSTVDNIVVEFPSNLEMMEFPEHTLATAGEYNNEAAADDDDDDD